MPTVQLNPKGEYTFARYNPYGGSVFTMLTAGSDRAHKALTIKNKLTVTNGTSGEDTNMLVVGPSPAQASHASQVNISNFSTAGSACIKFGVSGATYCLGTAGATTMANRDFAIKKSTALEAGGSGIRTDSNTALAFSNALELFLPNIDELTQTNYLRYNSSTAEVTWLASTQKIKKNIISPPSKVYDNILALQPRYFEMKNPKEASIQYLSFIAEETAAASPKFATYGPDWAYDDTGLQREEELLSDKQVPIDINDRAIIAALVGKVQQLEQRLQQLESQ